MRSSNERGALRGKGRGGRGDGRKPRTRLEPVVSAAPDPVRPSALGALLQQGRAGGGRHSLLLLVPAGARSRQCLGDSRRLFRDGTGSERIGTPPWNTSIGPPSPSSSRCSDWSPGSALPPPIGGAAILVSC